MHDLSERIATAEAKLDGMRAKRGAAILDDADFDAAEYASTEAELAALRDAENIQVHRQRAGARGAREARTAELRDTIADLERKRIVAITECEEFARSMVAATRRVLDITAREALAVHELSGKVPIPLSSINAENRLSLRFAAVMQGLKKAGANRRFGHVEWPPSMHVQAENWAVEEAKAVAGHLKNLAGE